MVLKYSTWINVLSYFLQLKTGLCNLLRLWRPAVVSISVSLYVQLPLSLSRSPPPHWTGVATVCFHRIILLMFTGIWQGSGAAPECFQRSFALRGPQRPHGEESLPLSNWISSQEEREREVKRKRERKVALSGSQCIILLGSWILQAAGQEMRRRTPTDLQPLAASQPITETI